jgi:membrane-associated phospholipid phosphatase
VLAETSAQAPGRRRGLPSPEALRELAIFAVAYLTYFGVRAITEGEPWRAFGNAMTVHRFEVELGVDWEGAIQRTVLGSKLLVDATNAVYIYGHWPVLIAAGVLLYRRRRPLYYRLRNVCLLTGLIGLVIFVAFPVAPPRLTDLPVIDTVTRDAEGYRQLLPASLVNQYAAMPSFHAGWNLLVGVVAFTATRNLLVRSFAVLMPAAMAFAVVATANHYVADVLVGATIVLAALALIGLIDRRRLDRGDEYERGDRHLRRTATVRRRASCGQRPRTAPRRRGAPASAGRG